MTKKDSTSVEHVLGHDKQKLEKETALLRVKRRKRLRKIEVRTDKNASPHEEVMHRAEGCPNHSKRN